MTFSESVKTCMMQKVLCIQGRACRSEYWWFVLFSMAAQFVLGIVSALGTLFAVIALVPDVWIAVAGITVAVRRLHDTDKSGWFLLLPTAIALVGIVIVLLSGRFAETLSTVLLVAIAAAAVWLLIQMIKPGTAGPNRFGDPVCGTFVQSSQQEQSFIEVKESDYKSKDFFGKF